MERVAEILIGQFCPEYSGFSTIVLSIIQQCLADTWHDFGIMQPPLKLYILTDNICKKHDI